MYFFSLAVIQCTVKQTDLSCEFKPLLLSSPPHEPALYPLQDEYFKLSRRSSYVYMAKPAATKPNLTAIILSTYLELYTLLLFSLYLNSLSLSLADFLRDSLTCSASSMTSSSVACIVLL
ncbi:hypothetical protein P389DRAFT_36554 [Cystobasidium minutum MCA 4210]|uniref:uncharacterized protein n=1 Tax=Cystobasidium minutum MCA 4210 TaxID=1397322 RepID=UPI0034CF6F6B|eukprot:jgi/Rhomi1/36554/CE36553_19